MLGTTKAKCFKPIVCLQCYAKGRFFPFRFHRLKFHYLKMHMDIDYSLHSKELANSIDLKEGIDWIWYTDKFLQAHNDRVEIGRLLGVKTKEVQGVIDLPKEFHVAPTIPQTAPSFSNEKFKRDETSDPRICTIRDELEKF
jgi:hypothetical protein